MDNACPYLKDILQRGAHEAEVVPGHGIGLAIVRDIVEAYQLNVA